MQAAIITPQQLSKLTKALADLHDKYDILGWETMPGHMPVCLFTMRRKPRLVGVELTGRRVRWGGLQMDWRDITPSSTPIDMYDVRDILAEAQNG